MYELFVYDPRSETWSTGPPMPTPRYALAAAVIDGKLYAAGGRLPDSGGLPAMMLEVFDPKGQVCLCHYPSGNPNLARTICVDVAAVEAHLSQHGDALGECAF
jgi:hypothetical protein